MTGFVKRSKGSVDDDGVGSCRQVLSGTSLVNFGEGAGCLGEGGAQSHCSCLQLSLL